MFPSKYLCAADLQNKDVTVTVESIRQEGVLDDKGKSEKKWIVKLKKTDKLWILNITNCRVIAKYHGTEVDDWNDKKVILYPTTCEAFGKTVECIRVRDKDPGGES
jgi:hypothetical protein